MFYEEFSMLFSEGGSSQVLFSLALALFLGLFVSRLIKPLKLPAVTGYLITGVLIGPYCLGLLGITGVFSSAEAMKGTSAIVQDVALGFIAFAIGTEFKLSSLKQTGRQAMIVGCAQAIITMIVVDAVLIGLSFLLGQEVFPLSVAITLGAIATATAPAATIMVIKQYKAKGPVTSMLLPVVALDDAVGLVCFAVSMGVAQAISGGEVSIISVLVNPILEVVLSLALGALMGFLLTVVEDHFQSNSKRLCLSITFVLLTVALAQMKFDLPGGVEIAFSNLLVCMMLGTLFCNICDSADELMERTDKWTMPILILFFVFSGAELDLVSIFKSPVIVLIGVVYVLFRAFGKYIGAFLSARFAGCDPKIVKYLGFTLFPQAGVALGMSAIAATALGGDFGSMVRNIVLFGVLIYELVGPMITKIALTKAGDITPKVPKGQPAEPVAEIPAAAPAEEIKK